MADDINPSMRHTKTDAEDHIDNAHKIFDNTNSNFDSEQPPHETNTPAQSCHKTSQQTRFSSRARTAPKHLEEFHIDLPPSLTHLKIVEGSSAQYLLVNFVSYKNFSNSHKAFLATITSHDEPINLLQVVKDSNWRDAMSKEIRAHEENGTWTLTKLLTGKKKAIDSKWVYKMKYKHNGEIERYKL